jgi:hypothetical protein
MINLHNCEYDTEQGKNQTISHEKKKCFFAEWDHKSEKNFITNPKFLQMAQLSLLCFIGMSIGYVPMYFNLRLFAVIPIWITFVILSLWGTKLQKWNATALYFLLMLIYILVPPPLRLLVDLLNIYVNIAIWSDFYYSKKSYPHQYQPCFCFRRINLFVDYTGRNFKVLNKRGKLKFYLKSDENVWILNYSCSVKDIFNNHELYLGYQYLVYCLKLHPYFKNFFKHNTYYVFNPSNSLNPPMY